jgi:hypothetical protein
VPARRHGPCSLGRARPGTTWTTHGMCGLIGLGPIEFQIESGFRFMGGLSDVDILVNADLRDINAESSRSWPLLQAPGFVSDEMSPEAGMPGSWDASLPLPGGLASKGPIESRLHGSLNPLAEFCPAAKATARSIYATAFARRPAAAATADARPGSRHARVRLRSSS